MHVIGAHGMQIESLRLHISKQISGEYITDQ
jgi:hypothetical protein